MVEVKLNMEALVDSSFNTLPVQLQINILQSLKLTDLKSAKLVCPYWFRLHTIIRPPRFHLRDNKIGHLQILKESFYSNIQFLKVSNYTAILPICTFKRCGIPKTEVLELSDGNSAENMMKLLRSYAKFCYGLVLTANCFGKLVQTFRLKGLFYESLHCLAISFQGPLNNLQDFGRRTHLIALTQFLQTTKIPSLQILDINSPRWLPAENSAVEKFKQAINIFFEKHGSQFTELKYENIPPSVVINTFKHLCNLESLSIQFNNDQIVNINGLLIRQSLRQLKQLKSLSYTAFEAFRIHAGFISSLLIENRNCITKFCLHGLYPRMNWIPVSYEVKLKEVKLRFMHFREDLFAATTNENEKLKYVSKLHLLIEMHSSSQDWFPQVSTWIISAFPNLECLTLQIPTRLTLPVCRLLISNLVHLKKFIVFNVYTRMMTDEARIWFRRKYHGGFIKSILLASGLEISIRRPLPNNIFD